MKDPKMTVLDLVENGWDTSNTDIGYEPDFHTGWHNPEATEPEVTVSALNDETPGIGGTGFTGIDPSGAGGIQHPEGIVSIDCWSDREVEDDVNPKTVTFNFSEEVKRIIKNNTLSATDLTYLVYNGRDEVPPDGDEATPTFHYQVRAWYQYEERP